MNRTFSVSILCVLAAIGAQAQDDKSRWNASPEATALYGHCGSSSSMGSKLDTLQYVGEPVTDVLAIKVLNCSRFGAGSGFSKVACPADNVYDFCMRAPNDGRGNDVTLGVVKLSARTDPNALYEGCPSGAQAQPKLALVTSAGRDPRTLSGITTVACTAATTNTPTPARATECPSYRHPYHFCLSTPNDGHGNAVAVGVVLVNGAGDAFGLYGECDSGVAPGYASKASLVSLMGHSMDNVRAIDLVGCAIPWGWGPGFPDKMLVGACVGNKWMNQAVAKRYDYCIWGTDERSNGVMMGVVGP
jgi:hypothetical protein